MRDHRKPLTAAAAVTAALLLTLTGCGAGTPSADGGSGSTPAATRSAGGSLPTTGSSTASSPSASAKPPKHHPSGPPLQISSIAPLSGATVSALDRSPPTLMVTTAVVEVGSGTASGTSCAGGLAAVLLGTRLGATTLAASTRALVAASPRLARSRTWAS